MKTAINTNGVMPADGKVMVRVDVELDAYDSAYNDYLIHVPVIPPGGYPGKTDKDGVPLDMDAYKKWEASLPEELALGFHISHFIAVDPEATRDDVEVIIKRLFDESTLTSIHDRLAAHDIPGVQRMLKAIKGPGRTMLLPKAALEDLAETMKARLKEAGTDGY